MMMLFIFLKIGAILAPFGEKGPYLPAVCEEERIKVEKELTELTYPFMARTGEEFVVVCELIPPTEGKA